MAVARLRQVALVAADLEPVLERLEREVGLDAPFRDPQVAVFGLRNAVFAIGDTFLEVVSPAQPGTAAGRYLERRGGDAGYMAIFQVGDVATARRRVDGLGIRVAWQVELEDIAAIHLHPADVPGAIVSLDAADPPASWRWAGPAWTGGAPTERTRGAITSLTVHAAEPEAVAQRWAQVLGVTADGARITLGGGRQTVDFEPAAGRADEGIAAIGFERTGAPAVADVCGVRLRGRPA